MQAAQRQPGSNGAETEADLVARIVSGDGQAFESLMRRYNRPLFRTARSIVKNDADAEDVLQDAYLIIFRRLHTFRGDASLSTWLTRVVVNEAIARYRKTARVAKIIDFEAMTPIEDEETAMKPEDQAPEQPEEATLRGQVRKIVEQKIDELPAAFRTVFVMRALEEMTVEETAQCLDIPEATVRSRFFRARGLLRESIAREIDLGLEDAFSFDGERCNRIVAAVLRRLADETRAGDDR